MSEPYACEHLSACVHALQFELSGFVMIRTEQSEQSISLRPHYCDRGRYKWLVTSKDERVFTVDGADAFPRYYFFPEAMILEILGWCQFREQTILSIRYHAGETWQEGVPIYEDERMKS